jgi:hypothetical protein
MALDLAKAARAYDALTKLLGSAEECRALFEQAGLPYPLRIESIGPEPAAPSAGGDGSGGNGSGGGRTTRRRRSARRQAARTRPRVVYQPTKRPAAFEMVPLPFKPEEPAPVAQHAQIPPMPTPPPPPGVKKDWINVPIASLLPQTLTLGILRDSLGRPLPRKDLLARMAERGARVNDGSLANIGTRLSERHQIHRVDEGWLLVDESTAPILNGRYAWGDAAVFAVHELAARRREAVLHLLRVTGRAMKQNEIAAALRGCSWLKTPVSKDLIKMDIGALVESGQVVKLEDEKGWAIKAP